MADQEEHGVVLLHRMLKELDGKRIRVDVEYTRRDPGFDRAVREALDRLHRRATIAGG